MRRGLHKSVVQVMDWVPGVPHRTIESFQLAFVRALRDRGWRTAFVFADHPHAAFRARLGDLDTPYSLARFQPTPRQAAALGRRLRRWRPDVIQTHWMSKFSPAIPILKLVSGSRYLITTDHSSGEASGRNSTIGRMVDRLRGAYAGTYTDWTIAVSEFVRRRDVERLPLSPRTTRTIHNGVDPDHFKPRPCENAVPIVAYAGQLIPEKGVLTFLRAAQELVRDGRPTFEIRVAGAGKMRGELERYVTEHGLHDCVEFLGEIPSVAALFSSADVVVVPSEWAEAFGITVIEAMAAGACLLVSDAGAIPEVVGFDGACGDVFRAGDVADLKVKLASLLDDPARRKRLRDAARERVVAGFTIDRMVRHYVDVYEELDQKHRG